MTSLETRTPNFPEHPEDGFVVKEYLDDGRILVWTYNKALNQWAAHFVYPEEAATEGWVLGQGYVQGPVRTKDVQTTDPAVVVDVDGAQSILSTQEEVNNFIADAADTAIKAASRTGDVVDFLQNSIGKGTWLHAFAGVGFPQKQSSGLRPTPMISLTSPRSTSTIKGLLQAEAMTPARWLTPGLVTT